MNPLLLLAVSSTLALAQVPMVPSDLHTLQEPGEIRPSPDGSIVLFTLATRDLKANQSASKLMRLSPQGGSPSVVSGLPDGVDHVRWAPDGRRIAFFASRNGKRALWVFDFGRKKLTRVCDYDRSNSFLSKSGNSLAWSPDGTRLAFSGTLDPQPPVGDPLVITRILYKSRTSFSDNRRSHVFVVPATGGTPRPVTSGNYDEHSIDWGGDGSEIVFLSNREPDPDANYNYDLFAVNVASQATRRITETPGVEMNPTVSPDGRTIAYIATTRSRTTIDSVAEDAHVWVIPFSGGTAREINADLDRRSGAPEWSPDGKWIYYTATDHGRGMLYRVAPGGVSTPLFQRDAQISEFAITRDRRLFFGMSDAAAPREVFTLPEGSSEPQPITTLNSARVRNWQFSSPKTIRFRSFDGVEVEGWLYPPVKPAPGKWPLILSIHGGPHSAFGYAFNPSLQVFAGHGYAVLALNPRGSNGYGQKFSDGCLNDWGGGDYRDLMAGVDYALRAFPEIDPDRLGLTGGSYGGFMTNWVITQTNRFRAAVTVASLSNLISFYATSLYQDLVHVEFNGYPWEGSNFATLWKWSPLAHVANVRTPTLLLHGEQDNDVHITQAEELYTALRYRGVDSVLVRYPREGHGFREPKHQLDSTVRTLEWMDKYLKAPARAASGK